MVSILRSITLSACLLVSLAALFLLARVTFMSHITALSGLDFYTIGRWISSYGRSDPWSRPWLLSTISLLTLLGVNTLFCTTSRALCLIREFHLKKGKATKRLIKKLSIHGIHYSFLIIISGYLVSLTTSTVYFPILLTPNKTWSSPGGDLSIRLSGLKRIFYTGPLEAMKGRVTTVKVLLDVWSKDGSKTTWVSTHSGAFFKGNVITIRDFPKNNRGKWVAIYLRKDPGLPIYALGLTTFFLFTTLYAIYSWPWEHWLRGGAG